MSSTRKIDQLMIAEVDKLCMQADVEGKEVDWETATLVPRRFANMHHHQRDFLAREATKRQSYREINDCKDNDAASPEQAWAEGRE